MSHITTVSINFQIFDYPKYKDTLKEVFFDRLNGTLGQILWDENEKYVTFMPKGDCFGVCYQDNFFNLDETLKILSELRIKFQESGAMKSWQHIMLLQQYEQSDFTYIYRIDYMGRVAETAININFEDLGYGE